MKKTSVQSNINLETLAGGAFAEKLNEALMQVAENIQNPNTEATTKRQIQITLKFAPNKTRQLVSTQIAVTTKLAATEAIDTQMIMGINMRTGQIEIAEYDGQIRGQMSFNDLQAQEQPAEPAQATTPAANETQPAAGAEEQQPAPTGKPLDLKNRNSDFVFRVSEGRGGAPVFKLVAADGGVWKSQAVANVKAYLTEALKDIPDRDKITIIA